MASHIEPSRGDCARIRHGNVAVEILDARDESEVAVAGVIRVESTPEELIQRFRDIVRFKRNPNVLEIGVFSAPPSLADVESLTIEGGEVGDLRDCGVGDCALKLSAEAMSSLQKEVDWSSPDAREQATRFMHRMLIGIVDDYTAGGSAALGSYVDEDEPFRPAAEFDAILEVSPYLARHAPELRRYLAEYPHSSIEASDEFFYWSRERLGVKSVISVTHVTIYRPPPDAGIGVLIASKQIYASHYFRASLGLAAFTPGEATGAPGYLIYVNRSRLDTLEGAFSALRRKIIQDRLKAATESSLLVTRGRLR